MQIDQSLSASCLPTPLNDEAKRNVFRASVITTFSLRALRLNDHA